MTEPMLAATLTDLSEVRYPVACTPKVDGYRCMIQNGIAIGGRKGKAIKNHHVQQILKQMSFLEGYDGELIVPGQPFHKAGGLLRQQNAEVDFKFLLFDNFRHPTLNYIHRVDSICDIALQFSHYIGALYPAIIRNEKDLIEYEKIQIENGYEGIMLRDPSGTYKFGRSTLREFGLVKWKRFIDAEAVVVGFEELQRNLNPEERDEYGHIDRPTHMENKVGAGTLGSLVATWKGLTINVGSGFTEAQRREIWSIKTFYLGKVFTFKYQLEGTDIKPRQPIFKDWRE